MLADRPDGRRLTADEQRQLDDLERRLLHGPAAPRRTAKVGLAAITRPTLDRRVLAVGVVVLGGLLVLAVIVGGPAGAAATGCALLATLVGYRLLRVGLRRWVHRS
jgi:hypothetical protein